jgi:hypothetical protein
VRRQAFPAWELERAIRRQVLRERVLVFAGGVLLALVFFGFLLVLGTLA